jgi:hypothetical protein
MKNPFAIIYCTRLKYEFGIKTIIGFTGMPLWSGLWLGSVIKIVIVGAL